VGVTSHIVPDLVVRAVLRLQHRLPLHHLIHLQHLRMHTACGASSQSPGCSVMQPRSRVNNYSDVARGHSLKKERRPVL